MPTFTRQEFFQLVRGLHEFDPLQAKLGFGIAPNLLGVWFDDTLRYADAKNFWDENAIPKNVIVTINSKINVKGSNYDDFLQRMKGLCITEDTLIGNREKYVTELLGKAISGALRNELAGNVEPLGNYFHGAPSAAKVEWRQLGHMKYEKVLPPQREKALAWVTKDVAGDASVYGNLLDAYVTKDGSLPLDEKIVTNIWRTIAKRDPNMRLYRSTPYGAAVPYPSVVGGAYLIKKIFGLTKNVTFPPRGSSKWEDWAVFYFGSIMAVQGFTDGNKRTARTAYAIVMLSGNVEFRAPTNNFGAQLAKMG
jgi:hypothetical protein